ncbi:MAG: selenide, water dikinase SelD [candidate division WOR-3 bacterium]|nr:MAG: selenide, water dikinase SelD [candidate division WOR-3 bacterium]
MAQALAYLPPIEDPNLLVGTNTADDAGVYRLHDDLALVKTIDILTPVVEDAYTFGMIAAANCISDIYAMGGDPKLALNIVGYPGMGEPKTLGEMLKGGSDKAKEASVTTIGGHTFASPEVMYGLSVLGYIHPKKIITNAGVKPGDVLILTKPLGVGTIIQAMLMGKDDGIDMAPVIAAMTSLNKDASIAMRKAEANGATDVTGYGLIGHLVEMSEASNIGIELSLQKIPTHEGAVEILDQGIFEPGITMNLNSFSNRVDKGSSDSNLVNLIFGSETSGGLIIALPEERVEIFKREYTKDFAVIGRATAANSGRVTLAP